jgi:hypothetical protein
VAKKIKSKDWIKKIVVDWHYSEVSSVKVYHCAAYGRNGKQLFASEPNGYTIMAARSWVKNILIGLKYTPDIVWV